MTMDAKYQPKFAIYLLHCETLKGEVEHYIGSARLDQLARRLRMHSQRNGSKATKRMYATHPYWMLARVWRSHSRTLETLLHRAGNAETFCPVCRPALAKTEASRPRRLRMMTLNQDEPVILTWSAACGPN